MRLTGPLKAYELDLNASMNATPKMDNFAKKCIFLGDKTKVSGGYLVYIPKPFEVTGSMKIDKALKLMARKVSRATLHHKGLQYEVWKG
jgi:hypothetical protein